MYEGSTTPEALLREAERLAAAGKKNEARELIAEALRLDDTIRRQSDPACRTTPAPHRPRPHFLLGRPADLRRNLRAYSHISDSPVYYNNITGSGTALNSYASLPLPLLAGLPPVPSFTPGTQNIDVPENGSLTVELILESGF